MDEFLILDLSMDCHHNSMIIFQNLYWIYYCLFFKVYCIHLLFILKDYDCNLKDTELLCFFLQDLFFIISLFKIILNSNNSHLQM